MTSGLPPPPWKPHGSCVEDPGNMDVKTRKMDTLRNLVDNFGLPSVQHETKVLTAVEHDNTTKFQTESLSSKWVESFSLPFVGHDSTVTTNDLSTQTQVQQFMFTQVGYCRKRSKKHKKRCENKSTRESSRNIQELDTSGNELADLKLRPVYVKSSQPMNEADSEGLMDDTDRCENKSTSESIGKIQELDMCGNEPTDPKFRPAYVKLSGPINEAGTPSEGLLDDKDICEIKSTSKPPGKIQELDMCGNEPTDPKLHPAYVKLSGPMNKADTPSEGLLDDKDRTTLVIKNIPRYYTMDHLFQELSELGFGKCIDRMNLPEDKRTGKKCGGKNRGYSFVNLRTHELAFQCMQAIEGHVWKRTEDTATVVQHAAATWALVQGVRCQQFQAANGS